MRLIKPDSEGYIICPQCKRRYKPDLPIPEKDDPRKIQDIYPDATIVQREQQLTGLCSHRCFMVHLQGVPYCPHCEDTELWEMKEPTPSGHTHQCPNCKSLHAPYGLNE